ncbi:MAG: hypothetical protein USCAAHI_02896 [Beijerinckiaceae bacterium]|nr:MAG: hypothetical protein USCAAHI_02896 [Beijerinckiaceae bacterium]
MNQNIKRSIAQRGLPRRRKKAPERSLLPNVLPLRAAAVEPAWSKGKLILLPFTAESDKDSVVLALAFKLLREEIACLAADAALDAEINQRIIYCLWSVAGRIPAYVPAQDKLFYLAHLKEFLEAYAKIGSDIWPDFFVSRFAAVTDFFDRTIQQFPKWRHFVSDAEKDPLTCEEAAEIPVLAHVMVAALRESETRNFIDPAIPSALEVFQAPLLFQAPSQSESLRQEEQFGRPGEASKLLLANDLFASIDNVAKRTAEAALEIKNFGGPNGETGFKNEAFSSAGEDAGQAYIWMTRTLSKLVAGSPALALHSRFCWLKPILCRAGF